MKEFKYGLECVKYTLNHKRAFLKVEKELLGKNTLKGYLHDIDKVLMYPIFGKEITSRYHRRNRAHHIESNKYKTKKDFIESVIDWECARYTKPDKPLNARETLYKFYPEYKNIYLPIIEELGL